MEKNKNNSNIDLTGDVNRQCSGGRKSAYVEGELHSPNVAADPWSAKEGKASFATTNKKMIMKYEKLGDL